MYDDQGAALARSGHSNAAYGAAMQGQHLQGMINQTMGATSKENDRRAALALELRRMEQEKQKKQMELDALLARIAQASQQASPPSARRVSFPGGSITHQ